MGNVYKFEFTFNQVTFVFLASRLEEREADQKAEFDRLHERYNALLRTHVDHMERTKYLMGNDKFELMQNMPIPQAQLRTRMGMAASVDASNIRGVSDLISAHMSQSTTMDVNLANHISNEADWQDEFPSDVEPSPREVNLEEDKSAAVLAVDKTPEDSKESGRHEEYDLCLAFQNFIDLLSITSLLTNKLLLSY
uniref:TLE_N domain-containing protein n=1 Tax=Angiostrongylus cantonensis TaxID=6313 RepID=A0A0K0D385_ANGCA